MQPKVTYVDSNGDHVVYPSLAQGAAVRVTDETRYPSSLLGNITRTSIRADWLNYAVGTWTSYHVTHFADCILNPPSHTRHRTLTARWNVGSWIGSHVTGYAIETVKIPFVPGKYRLWAGKASCKPYPVSGFDRCWKGLQYTWSYRNREPISVLKRSSGVVYNSANLSMYRYIPANEWIELEVLEDTELTLDVFPFDANPITTNVGIEVVFQPNTEYVAALEWGVDTLELYGVETSNNYEYGITYPDLYRRIMSKEDADQIPPEVEGREYMLQVQGMNSYRETEVFVHKEDHSEDRRAVPDGSGGYTWPNRHKISEVP